MQHFVDAVIAACGEVDASIRSNSDERAYAHYEAGAGGDLSSGFDLLAEEIFFRHLAPYGRILSEESGLVGEGDDLIILDPVDGSDNLKSHLPYYGASVALQRGAETVCAVVCNFANGDCFVRYGEHHYRCTLSAPSERSAVVANPHAAIGLFEKAFFNPDYVARLKEAGLKFRAPGAVALSLAYAHYVKYVVFLGTMRPYDLEAGLYLCSDLYRYSDDRMLIVASERAVFEKICAIFNAPRES